MLLNRFRMGPIREATLSIEIYMISKIYSTEISYLFSMEGKPTKGAIWGNAKAKLWINPRLYWRSASHSSRRADAIPRDSAITNPLTPGTRFRKAMAMTTHEPIATNTAIRG